MSTTLSITVDDEVLALAEQQARAHDTQVSSAIDSLLQTMAENFRLSRQGLTPVTDRLRGIVQIPTGRDWRDLAAEARIEKHGGV